MNISIPVKATMSANLIKSAGLNPRIPVSTLWGFEHYRRGANGLYLLDKWEQLNVLTDEGLNAMLNIMFHNATQIATWYIALFESNTTPLVTHTYAVPGYTECTAYTEAARQAYVEAEASGKSITNTASKATFTFNATKTIYGAALVGGGSAPTDNTDTAGGGTLFASSKFADAKPVVSTDILQVTCAITLADS